MLGTTRRTIVHPVRSAARPSPRTRPSPPSSPGVAQPPSLRASARAASTPTTPPAPSRARARARRRRSSSSSSPTTSVRARACARARSASRVTRRRPAAAAAAASGRPTTLRTVLAIGIEERRGFVRRRLDAIDRLGHLRRRKRRPEHVPGRNAAGRGSRHRGSPADAPRPRKSPPRVPRLRPG